MGEPPRSLPTAYQEQIALLRFPNGLLRIIGWMILVHVGVLVALGMLFMATLLPLSIAVVRLAVVWDPAYHLMGRIMGVRELPRLSRPPLWLVIYSILWVAFQLALFGVLARVLFIVGFCNQNLICLAFRLLAK